MKKTIIALCLICLGIDAQAQFKIGVRAGVGYSNQYVELLDPNFYWVSGSKEKQKGHEFYITGELYLNRYLSLTSEIGYIEKGFYSDRLKWDIIRAGGSFERSTVETKNLSFNLLTKIGLPLKYDLKPFMSFGVKLDHMYHVDDWIFKINDTIRDDYHNFIFRDYRDVVASGIVGVGITWLDAISIEYQFVIPAMSSVLEKYNVRDRYQGISIGVKLYRIGNRKTEC